MGNRVDLDLTSENNDRYVVLVSALEEYAATLEHQAEEEERSDVENGRDAGSPQVTGFRAYASIAKDLLDAIEEQLSSGSSTDQRTD